MAEGQAPAGPAGQLLNLVGEAQEIMDMPNLLLAKATLDVLKFLPKMPAARLFGDLVFQYGHSHPHPPTFGVPIPSVGPILAAGAVNVLINGLPAARNGDLGLAAWCGGYFPIFEVMFGSSHVFIGGSRAARMLMDPTLHCLPDMFSKGKGMSGMTKAIAKAAAKEAAKAAAKSLVQSVVMTGAMKALQAAAEAEQAEATESEGEADGQAAADAEIAAAKAAAEGVEAAMTALQMAADAVAAAMGALLGKDPGVGFPLGFIMMGSPNVLIGGFPMPGWSTILKGLGKLLKPLIRKIQLKLPPGRLRQSLCFLTGHPVEVASGRMFTSKTDFQIDGRILLDFKRVYDTSAIDYEGSLGWGWMHPYDQHLWESKKYNCLILRDKENRQIRFDKLAVGARVFQPLERMWLERSGEFEYKIFDCKDALTYRFGAVDNYIENFVDEKNALRLLDISDRNGNLVELEYRDSLLSKIRNGTETHVEIFYNSIAGKTRLTEIVQHLKNNQTISLMRFGYNEEAELHTATDRTYQPFIYEYENHLLTKETNRNKVSFYFEYDGTGNSARCVHTWGDGNIYERWLTYSPKAKITKVRDGLGGETVYHYNDLDLITKIFDPDGGVSLFEYGEFGELTSETDEVGRTRIYSYDEELNRISVVQEDGTQRRILFNEFGSPVAMFDESGGEWSYEYDEKGNVVASITPLKARREFEYNLSGDLVRYKDALGNETAFEWTQGGLIASILRPLGGKSRYVYNERNLLSEVVRESANFRIRYEYDDAGRIARTSEINARNETFSVEKFEYDDQNNLTRFTDALGNRTFYSYIGLDKISEKIDALGFRQQYRYDVEENLIEFINERGESYQVGYDLLDRIISETGFDGETTVYQYNQAGDLVYQKDDLGRETFYRHDPCGRLLSRLRSDTSTVNFSYDECGRVIYAQNGQSEVSVKYDASWRVASEIQNGQIINYAYDDENRRIARQLTETNEISGNVEYDYDAEGNLISFTIAGREINYRRDSLGRITNKILPNGLQEFFDYDANGHLQNQKISVGGGRDVVRRTYQWNPLGNITEIDDSLRGVRRFQYDAVERLSRVERTISGPGVTFPEERQNLPPETGGLPPERRLWQADDFSANEFGRTREIEEFQYDADGNLLERNASVRGARKFSYGRGDKLEQQERLQYIYDAAGNLVEKRQPGGDSTRYEYDADNQLIGISDFRFGKIEFEYDAFGRRTKKITEQGTTVFLWDGDVLLGEQKDSFCEYVHEDFVPLARFQDFQVQIYHTDYLGTPKEISAADGALIWQGIYDEYGKVSEVISQTTQPIRFQNQYEDFETGLYYNRYRYYDADAGRYINQDPINLLGGTNFYLYGVNPLMWIDPLGLVKKPAAAGVPSKPGIYVLTDPGSNESYVGQGVDMEGRLSQTKHKKAQEMLDRPGVKVQYVEVDLGPDADSLTLREKKRMLSRFEQEQFELQKKKGHTMLNSPKSPPESAQNKKRNQDLIDDKGAKKKRKKTC